MKKKTTIEFIEEAKKIHNNKYDYSKVEYINKRTKVCIICPEHGEFWQRPTDHLQGSGCYYCGRKKCTGKKVTTDSFIETAKKIHGDKYDYSKVEYSNSKEKICIICPEHGEFYQLPTAHLQGQGCPKCKKYKIGKNKYNTQIFIEKSKLIHGNKYDYSKVNYIDSITKVCIICPEHGEFWQEPNSHLRGNGCKKCATDIKKKIVAKNFVLRSNEIHNKKYDYSKSIYKGWNEKVCIICPEHGEFWQNGGAHLMGAGCPKCNKSKLEIEISNFLNENNINYVEGEHFAWLGKQHLDFYLPDYKIAIECQGEEHFKEINFFGGKYGFIYTNKRDINKNKLCKQNSIKLLYYTNLNYDNFLGEKLYKDKDELLKEIKGG